ncbi:hypothetical protein AGMMS49938_12880 [Fibrobacterales bacterium]|nr:hypothetical protein AGMMS49938_12880 [Fibrobacterales bacterium]
MPFIFILLFFSALAFCAPTESYADLAKKVQSGDFTSAQSGLEQFVKGRWKSGSQERGVVLYIENSLRLGKLDDVKKYARQFLDFFPKSVYRARVETAVAISSVLSKDPYTGAETLRRILAYTKNPSAAKRARELLTQILSAELLSENELRNLLEKGFADSFVTATAEWRLGAQMQKEGRYKAAKYWYDEAKKANSSLAERSDKAIAVLDGKGAGTPIILVLAPLSGNFAELGSYMVQGILLATDNLKEKNVKIQITDDRADPATALRRVKLAIAQDSIVGIIGPLLSAPAATVAAWMGSNAPQIPLITPTATDDGISAMGKNIFQLNVSTAVLAQTIAEYAMNCLNINEFAIMSPLGDYGTAMADEFQRAVEQRGGAILISQNYTEGLPDYQNSFKLLRDRKLTLDTRRMNMGRGVANLNAIAKRDSWIEDSTLTFQAIFIPSTNAADAGLMAAQVAFNKLKVQYLLGSSGWFGREFFSNAKKQAENSFFSIAFSGDSQDSAFKAFAGKFKNKWSAEPDDSKVAGLSYDAANILIGAILSGSAGGDLPSVILQKKNYIGVYGDIRFFGTGANIDTSIMGVEQGKFVEKSVECKE